MNTLAKDSGTSGRYARKYNGQNIKAHTHVYVQHSTWETHVTCKLCGFSVTKTLLSAAINAGAISEVEE